MKDTILEQGPGYTIAIVEEAHGTVPYGQVIRDDGTNYGWVDLRDQPGLVDTIPEIQGIPGMQAILRVANTQQSPFMTIGCEKGSFPVKGRRPITRMVGGYIDLVFRIGGYNSTGQLAEVAKQIRNKVKPPENAVVGYEFLIQPLKNFFGQDGRYALMLKPQGYGENETTAWQAFEEACMHLANALQRCIEEFHPAEGVD